MQDMILLKLGEIVLKGLNKKYFEQKLISNVKRRLKPLGSFKVYCFQSTIYVEPQEEVDMDAALEDEAEQAAAEHAGEGDAPDDGQE